MPAPLPEINLVTAQNLPLRVFIGNSLAYKLVLTDNQTPTPQPINLTGATITLTVWNTSLTMSIGDGIVLGGTGHNELTFNKIVPLSTGVYIYLLDVTFVDGRKVTFFFGKLTVEGPE